MRLPKISIMRSISFSNTKLACALFMWISAMLLTPKIPSAQIFFIAQKNWTAQIWGGAAAPSQPPGSYVHMYRSRDCPLSATERFPSPRHVARIWNSLPAEVTSLNSLQTFKTKLKFWFILGVVSIVFEIVLVFVKYLKCFGIFSL